MGSFWIKENFFCRIRSFVKVEKKSEIITFNDQKLVVQGFDVPWDEIYVINLYKYDCITYEITCLCIDLEYGEYIELFEDMQGWDTFIEHLNYQLPISKDINLPLKIKNCKSSDGVFEVYRRGR